MTRSRVAHNALLNFLGLAVPLALAFFIVPIAALNLGPARFGILGLAWAITEYLTLFDLGLGRALVKFVADALHQTSSKLSEIVSLSMAAQVAAGLIGGAIVFLAAPVLVRDVFKVSPAVAGEALGVFRVVGLSVPFVLLMAGQRAVLEVYTEHPPAKPDATLICIANCLVSGNQANVAAYRPKAPPA